jgi:dihydrodipicolinate synthase/N-acetylneuraminate lyase
MSVPRTVNGVITALITPFDSDGTPQLRSLKQLVKFQLERKIQGLFPLGTTGMGILLDAGQRMKVAEAVVQEANGSVPVIVHTGALDTATTIELSKHAERIGATAVSCITPFFFGADDTAIIKHYESVSRAVSIPVFAYNNPKSSGVSLSVSALGRLSSEEIIHGLKDSSRDFLRLMDYMDIVPDNFTVLNGTESYALPSLLMGVDGFVSALANIIPETMIGLYLSYERGDIATALELQKKVRAVKRITEEGGLGIIYDILRARGVDCGYPRAPVMRPDGRKAEQLLEQFRKAEPELLG